MAHNIHGMEDHEYLLDLANRIMRVPVIYGVDGADIDSLGAIAKAVRKDFNVTPSPQEVKRGFAKSAEFTQMVREYYANSDNDHGAHMREALEMFLMENLCEIEEALFTPAGDVTGRAIEIICREAECMGFPEDTIAEFRAGQFDGDDLLTLQSVERALDAPAPQPHVVGWQPKTPKEVWENDMLPRLQQMFEKEKHRYRIGDETMRAVFEKYGMHDMSDLQAVMDAVEMALTSMPPQLEDGKAQPEAIDERIVRYLSHDVVCRANDFDYLDDAPCTCGLRQIYNPKGKNPGDFKPRLKPLVFRKNHNNVWWADCACGRYTLVIISGHIHLSLNDWALTYNRPRGTLQDGFDQAEAHRLCLMSEDMA